ncbi:MAG: hypothetical protein MHPSP_000327 [Paramarteilia canceri]
MSKIKGSLEEKERDIKRVTDEIAKMNVIFINAEKSQDDIKRNLNSLEKSISSEKRQKEEQISKLKRDLESQKSYNEILERKNVMRNVIYKSQQSSNDNNTTYKAKNTNCMGEDDDDPSVERLFQNSKYEFPKIKSSDNLALTENHKILYKNWLKKIKNVTGFAGLANLINGYENQDHLNSLLLSTIEKKTNSLASLSETYQLLTKKKDHHIFTKELHTNATSEGSLKLLNYLKNVLSNRQKEYAENKSLLNKHARLCSESKKNIQNFISIIISNFDKEIKLKTRNIHLHNAEDSTKTNKNRLISAGNKETLKRDIDRLAQYFTNALSKSKEILESENKDEKNLENRDNISKFYFDGQKIHLENCEVSIHENKVITKEIDHEALQDGQEDLLQFTNGNRVLSRSQIKQMRYSQSKKYNNNSSIPGGNLKEGSMMNSRYKKLNK